MEDKIYYNDEWNTKKQLEDEVSNLLLEFYGKMTPQEYSLYWSNDKFRKEYNEKHKNDIKRTK